MVFGAEVTWGRCFLRFYFSSRGSRWFGADMSRGRDGLGSKCPVTSATLASRRAAVCYNFVEFWFQLIPRCSSFSHNVDKPCKPHLENILQTSNLIWNPIDRGQVGTATCMCSSKQHKPELQNGFRLHFILISWSETNVCCLDCGDKELSALRGSSCTLISYQNQNQDSLLTFIHQGIRM